MELNEYFQMFPENLNLSNSYLLPVLTVDTSFNVKEILPTQALGHSGNSTQPSLFSPLSGFNVLNDTPSNQWRKSFFTAGYTRLFQIHSLNI